jgi:formyl-CoA transferase
VDYLFQDLKVIDAASFLAGPGAGTVMGDYGADVIKIEPLRGDGYRTLKGSYPVDYNWQLTSRNKRSLALNLDSEDGRGILQQLVQTADVLLVNYVGAQLTRFGLEYEPLRASNPRLIYAHLTGYGTQGPDASKRGFDSTAWWARSGMMEMVREPGQQPIMGIPGFGDHSSAMALFGGIMMALYRRERSGEGSYVTTSLAANGVWANGMGLQGVIAGFDLAEKRQQKGWLNPFSSVYPTADDRHVLLTIINPDREWPQLCRAVGREDWLEDPRFASMRSLFSNRETLIDMVRDITATLDLTELCARLDAYEITYGIIKKMSEVIEDEQLFANDILVETGSDDPSYPLTIANPLQLADVPKRSSGPAPAIGQHSREILAELGLSDARVAELIDGGVVGAVAG